MTCERVYRTNNRNSPTCGTDVQDLELFFIGFATIILSNAAHTTKHIYNYFNNKCCGGVYRVNDRYFFHIWYRCRGSKTNVLFAWLLRIILESNLIWQCLKICIQVNIFTITLTVQVIKESLEPLVDIFPGRASVHYGTTGSILFFLQRPA